MSEKPLWAPWRIDYIRGSKQNDGCVFCAYASHDPVAYESDLTIVATEHALVTLNRYPFAAGHLLVVPRQHTADLGMLSGAALLGQSSTSGIRRVC